MKLLDLTYDAFGLNINDLSIKIIKLEKRGNKFILASYGQTDLKPGLVQSGVIKNEKALTEAIKTACASVKGKKLKAKYAILSLPEEESFLQVIQMPKMDLKDLRSAVVFEAENYIPLPIEEVYLDFQEISPIKDILDHLDVFVAATRKNIVDSYVACVKAAGLTPLCAEVESLSISRTLVKNETSENPVILINLGKNNANFIVFSGRSVRFTYSIPISHNRLTQAISEALKVTPAEAEKLKIKYGLEGFGKGTGEEAKNVFKAMSPVLEELSAQITKNIDFYLEHASHEHLSSDGKIKKIIIAGGGADFKNMTDFLSKKTGIPAEVGNIFTNMPLAKKIKEDVDLLPFATAVGLSLNITNIENQ